MTCNYLTRNDSVADLLLLNYSDEKYDVQDILQSE